MKAVERWGMRVATLLMALMLVVGVGIGLAACRGTRTVVPAPSEEQPVESSDASSPDDAIQELDTAEDDATTDEDVSYDVPAAIDEQGSYTSKDEVALYLHTFGHLPNNYVTKEEAEDAGWKTEGLDLSEACPGKSIGGDRFGNREGRLPSASGRTWRECDIDYPGQGSRNAKRIVFSNDGLIYYTEDHYQSFERLY